MTELSAAKLSIRPGRLPAGGRVLDVGCGDGRHLAAAAARGCRATGIDYDAAALREARRRLSAPLDVLVADAAHLPFRDRAFDAVICTETLEHLPDDAGAMREIARVLTAGGELHGAVPSHFTELVYFALSRGYRDAPGGHVRIYAPRVLVRRLAAAGLAVRSFDYVHFVDSLLWLRFCLTDLARGSRRPRSDFEAAVLVAVALERPVPMWRRRLRAALGRSRFIAALEVAGALVWPKSLTFVARKSAVGRKDSLSRTGIPRSVRGPQARVQADRSEDLPLRL